MHKQNKHGFTIVELLIVIVVIAILAAITLIAYNGLQERAVKSSLSNDLTQTSRLLELDKIERGDYASTLESLAPQYQVQPSGDIARQYTGGGDVYCLTVTRKSVTMHLSNAGGAAKDGTCSGHTSGEPAVASIVHTQKGDFPGNSVKGGVTVQFSINYDIQPSDYVFILFNSKYRTILNLAPVGGGNITELYSKSMGASGYQQVEAFGGSGLSGETAIDMYMCGPFCSTNGGFGIDSAYIVYVIRGLGSNASVQATDTPYGARPDRLEPVTPLQQSISAGEMAIFTYVYYGSGEPSLDDGSSPAQTWTADSVRTSGSGGSPAALAALHTIPSAPASISYIVTMPDTRTKYTGTTLFTIKPGA